MKTKATYEKVDVARSSDPPPVGFLEVRKVVREHIPVHADADGHNTVGGYIDSVLADTAIEGGEVQSLTLELTEEYWKRLAAHVVKREQETRPR